MVGGEGMAFREGCNLARSPSSLGQSVGGRRCFRFLEPFQAVLLGSAGSLPPHLQLQCHAELPLQHLPACQSASVV